MLLDMFRNLRGVSKKTYSTKTLSDFLADRFGTTLGGDQGGEENSKSVVGELHDCGVLWRMRLIGLFVCLLWVASGGVVIELDEE
jgi:hypothetical protein